MERRSASAAARPGGSEPQEEIVYDRRWAGDARWAVGGASVFLAAMVLGDWAEGRLIWWRAGMWAVLAALLLVVLVPPRVTAGPGWLSIRGLWGEQRVRTDALVSLERFGKVAERLVLRDAFGRQAQMDLRIVTASPFLWHLLETDAQRSADLGWLPVGNDALQELRDRIDGDTVLAVFRVSELE